MDKDNLKIKNELNVLINEIVLFYNTNLDEPIQNFDEKDSIFNQDEIKIGIFGLTNVGKSTLINCLLKKDLLPTKIIANTNFISKLVSTRDEKLKTTDIKKNVSQLELSKDNIQNIISEIENGNPNDITQIEINHELPFENRIILYDTPGIEDFEHWRSDLTLDFVKEVDIIVLLFRHPINNSLIKFLREKAKEEDLKKIFFIMTHIDKGGIEIDLQRITQSNKNVVYDKLGIDPQIYSYNLKRELLNIIEENTYSKNISTLIDDILKFIYSDEKTIIQYGRMAVSYINILDDTLRKFKNRLSVLEYNDEEFRVKIEAKQDELEKSQQSIFELKDEVFSKLDLAFKAIEEDFLDQRDDLKDDLQMEFRSFSSGINQFLNSRIFPLVKRRLKEWEKNSNNRLYEIYNYILGNVRKEAIKITSIQSVSNPQKIEIHKQTTPQVSELTEKYNDQDANPLAPLLIGGGALALFTGTFALAVVPLMIDKVFNISQNREKKKLADMIPSLLSEIDFIMDGHALKLKDKFETIKIAAANILEKNLEEKINMSSNELKRLESLSDKEKDSISLNKEKMITQIEILEAYKEKLSHFSNPKYNCSLELK